MTMGEEEDEHVWLSLKNAKTLVGAIADALQELDPDNKDTYAANASAYIEKLSALDGAVPIRRGQRDAQDRPVRRPLSIPLSGG